MLQGDSVQSLVNSYIGPGELLLVECACLQIRYKMGPIREELSNRKEKAHQKLRDVLSPLTLLFRFRRNQERWESPCSFSQLVHCQPFELVQRYWGLRTKLKAQNCFPWGLPNTACCIPGFLCGFAPARVCACVHTCVYGCVSFTCYLSS